jgi:nitrogen fixation NifU-like protein
MIDLRELYQEVILDHNKNPRNAYKMTNATCRAEGYNPLCGDHLMLYLCIKNDLIEAASFEGSGCAISTASASLMTECLQGKTIDEANTFFMRFHNLMIDKPLTQDFKNKLELPTKLNVLAGVREFPARVKCATLAWHTLKAALQYEDKPASTEAA